MVTEPTDPDSSNLSRFLGWRRTPLGQLESTKEGSRRAEQLRETLSDMLDAEALVRGHRRRASALDVTDFEAAFDDLVNPRPRPVWLDLLADTGLFLAGAFLGFGTNIVTGGSAGASRGWLAIAPAVVIGALCIALKSLKVR